MNDLLLMRESLIEQIARFDKVNKLRKSIDNIIDELRKKSLIISFSCSRQLCIDQVNGCKCESNVAQDAFGKLNQIDLAINVEVNEGGDIRNKIIELNVGKNEKNVSKSVSIKRIKKHICHWPDCAKQFKCYQYLKRHQMIHSQKLKFTCKFCGLKLAQESYLDRHVKRKHLNTIITHMKRFECKLNGCGKRFTQKKSLKSHQMVSHFKIKPIKCQYQECSKKFTQKTNLEYHVMRFHLNRRPFKCDYSHCSYSSVNRFALNKHVDRVHLGIAKFKCEYNGCGKKYKDKENLNNHILGVHFKIKPFKCQFCSSSFVASNQLKKHEKKVHKL